MKKLIGNYKCINCQHEYQDYAGPTKCPKCGHSYVKWLNYAELFPNKSK